MERESCGDANFAAVYRLKPGRSVRISGVASPNRHRISVGTPEFRRRGIASIVSVLSPRDRKVRHSSGQSHACPEKYFDNTPSSMGYYPKRHSLAVEFGESWTPNSNSPLAPVAVTTLQPMRVKSSLIGDDDEGALAGLRVKQRSSRYHEQVARELAKALVQTVPSNYVDEKSGARVSAFEHRVTIPVDFEDGMPVTRVSAFEHRVTFPPAVEEASVKRASAFENQFAFPYDIEGVPPVAQVTIPSFPEEEVVDSSMFEQKRYIPPNHVEHEQQRAPENPRVKTGVLEKNRRSPGWGNDVSGETTLMLRNIPNKYTRDMLVEDMRARGVISDVDFLYMPVDLRHECNVGYCFVNVTSKDGVARFRAAFDSTNLPQVKSRKMCEVGIGNVQGRRANIEAYRNSAVMSLDEKYHPLLFDNGVQVKFPAPNMSMGEIWRMKPAKKGVSKRELTKKVFKIR